jgi:hypothetical protein
LEGLCISFSSLITLARRFGAMLNKHGDSEHPHVIPNIRGRISPFTTKYGASCWFSTEGQQHVEEVDF